MKKIDLHHGNCIEIMKQLEEQSIDLVVCDPPYKTHARGNSGGTGGFLASENGMNGNGGFEHNDLCISEYAPLLYRIMKNEAHGYLMTNDLNLVEFHIELKKCGFDIFKTLIWSKNNAICNQYYMNSHEYIIFFRKGLAKSINDCSTKSVLSYKNPINKIHPSEKPIELLKVLIENSSNTGDVVLDFCMGSGSTGKACKDINRRFIGIEIDEKYFNIATKSIENHMTQMKLF